MLSQSALDIIRRKGIVISSNGNAFAPARRYILNWWVVKELSMSKRMHATYLVFLKCEMLIAASWSVVNSRSSWGNTLTVTFHPPMSVPSSAKAFSSAPSPPQSWKKEHLLLTTFVIGSLGMSRLQIRPHELKWLVNPFPISTAGIIEVTNPWTEIFNPS